MARIRSIHPDVCRDDNLALVSPRAERTFTRLWVHLDDDGRALDHPKLLVADLYPLHDDVDADVVHEDLAELQKHGLIIRYSVGGKRYLSVKPESWKCYQKPRHPAPSKFPHPQEDDGSAPWDYDSVTADCGSPTAVDAVLLEEHSGCITAKRGKPPASRARAGVGGGEGGGVGEHHGADKPRRDDADGMPLQAEPELTYAQTLGRWVVAQGVNLPAKDRKAERYAAVLDCVVAHVPEEHPRRRGVIIAFIADYVADVTGEPPDGDTRGHLARLVGEFSAQAVMHAAGEAVGWGAGIGAEHADDPKAFTKYMARILYGERQTA